MPDQRTFTFLNPQPLGRTVIAWLYVDMAAAVLTGIVSLVTIADTAANDPSAPKDSALPSDLLVGLAGVVQLIVTLIVAFLVLKWIYRVNRNAHSAVSGLTNTPAWAVGWFFVPIAFLWKPFEAMRETWQVSTRPEGWRSVAVPASLRWWWGLFLVTNMLSQISLRIVLMSQTLEGMAVAAGFELAVAILSFPLDLIFIQIVRRLSHMQLMDLTFGSAGEPGEGLSPPARG